MTLETVTNGWAVYTPLDLGCVFVCMALETEPERSGRGQLDACDLLVNTHFMTTRTSGRDGRVDSLTLALVFVTLDAFGRISLWIERYGMRFRQRRTGGQQQNS